MEGIVELCGDTLSLCLYRNTSQCWSGRRNNHQVVDPQVQMGGNRRHLARAGALQRWEAVVLSRTIVQKTQQICSKL